MNITNNNHSQNFTATYLQNVNIKTKDKFGDYKDDSASVVSLDINDEQDMNSLYEVSNDWENKEFGYAWNIYADAIKHDDYFDVKKEHFLAITTQKDGYEKLDPSKVIGLSLFSEMYRPKNEISWLQVNPNSTFPKGDKRVHKGVGNAMLSYLKQNFTEKPIVVGPLIKVENSIKMLGFKKKTLEMNPSMFGKVNPKHFPNLISRD